MLVCFAVVTSCGPGGGGTVSYEKLGETKVTNITGFALNGAPLGVSAEGDLSRWRAESKDWGRLGVPPTLGQGEVLAPNCEGANGTFYATSTFGQNYELRSGQTSWTKLAIAVEGGAPEPVVANNQGDLAMQVRASDRNVVYRLRATDQTWVQASSRATDRLAIVRLADDGSIYFQSTTDSSNGPSVLTARGDTVAPVYDCKGAAILPYCSFQFAVSPTGSIALTQGGSGSRVIFRSDATTTFPTTAKELFTLPTGTASFLDFTLLSNGGVLGTANNGAYGQFDLYLRREGAVDWQKALELPGTTGGSYEFVRANNKGELFTSSRQSALGAGSVYRIRF